MLVTQIRKSGGLILRERAFLLVPARRGCRETLRPSTFQPPVEGEETLAQSRKIHGTAVAPGLAMAPVHVIRAAPSVIPTWSLRGEEVEGELKRLDDAITSVSTTLDEQRKKLLASGTSKQEAEIFSVHRMILQDPSARKKVERRVAEERINAEACVQHLIEVVEASLKGMEGDSVRSYAADISEPWRIVLQELMNSERKALLQGDERMVLAATDLTPHVVTFLDRDRVLAVVCETGGRFSHGAVLARSFGFPCVVGIPNLLSRMEQGMRVIVDGDAGVVQLSPDKEAVDHFLERYKRRQARVESLSAHAGLPSETSDGHEFRIKANIESVRDFAVEGFTPAHFDGVGLLRTEFLYMERTQFPSEEEQYRLYRRVIEGVEGRQVTIRTLDIGGDKQLPYFKTPSEINPALGWRGVRISLEWQDLLRVQLRAILRASEVGPVAVLFPMVTSHEEVARLHEIFNQVRAQLTKQGYHVTADIPVGIMVEVPSALLTLPRILQDVDFVSVGTNDLVQYLLACDRDNPWVSRLYEPYDPAVMWALDFVAKAAAAAGKPCMVCGEMAGDYATALLLLGFGYTGVSVATNFVAQVKCAIRESTLEEAQALAAAVMAQDTAPAIRKLLEEVRERLHNRLMGPAEATEPE
jgi:phosphotransferase system enzyme I (PtsI)